MDGQYIAGILLLGIASVVTFIVVGPETKDEVYEAGYSYAEENAGKWVEENPREGTLFGPISNCTSKYLELYRSHIPKEDVDKWGQGCSDRVKEVIEHHELFHGR